MTADTTHRTVTDTEKTKWNGAMPKSGGTFTGNIIAGASNQSPSTALLRNSKLVTGSGVLAKPNNGEIIWVYE